jgi:hypothetical protein
MIFYPARRLDIIDHVAEFVMDTMPKPDTVIAPVVGNHSMICIVTDVSGATTTVNVSYLFPTQSYNKYFIAVRSCFDFAIHFQNHLFPHQCGKIWLALCGSNGVNNLQLFSS